MLSALLLAAALAAPSRPAFEGCKWEPLSDAKLGIDLWVQRCDFQGRKTWFSVEGESVVMHYSDSKTPEKVIEVVAFRPGETAPDAMRRFFDAHTEKKLAKRCVIAKYPEDAAPPKGVKRYTFSPNAAYKKEIDARHEDGIPEPPCGDYGENADDVEYWEAHEGAHRVIYVRAGQDDPLFDEKTLRLH